ncbi:hypothetical protein [Actinopolyspora mortivallis]|uniref:Uncharacterized protein n=1 Tax=Actinopolyspora mortivallis TaxID=33906 RepID=A0A2T0GW08_ACTMO|nr:hypothetical protein [Actinopolyspora mortivallis]PRW63284.1 hypothetical protein CEP50_11195 [Actinopolyspora mortivallis]
MAIRRWMDFCSSLLTKEDLALAPGRYAAMAGTAVLAAVVLFVWERWSRGERLLWPRRARAYEGEG